MSYYEAIEELEQDIKELKSCITQQAAELAVAQVDAERYRWLRDTQEGKTVRIMYRREWDNAIDDAIRKEKTE